ncbi:SDR family NAD(P)-dependent oxidoreductase [Ralstonia sp.]|uniref:SDR family NAD(P)-dependent oxidoreductase n=1 Tax=Ralstonia sp. TaxID=54061 RepID=UPI00338DB32F
MVAGKVTLVTRAGAGIGRATALTFAEEGAKVVVSNFDADGGLETTELVRKAGGDATSIRADVSKAADVGAMGRPCAYHLWSPRLCLQQCGHRRPDGTDGLLHPLGIGAHIMYVVVMW